jgi:hypothetical protein
VGGGRGISGTDAPNFGLDPWVTRAIGVEGVRGGGSRSLEVRWIRRGPVPPALVEWFGPFRDPIERRVDQYLVEPRTRELGVKIRDALQVDLKVYRGSPGRLRVPAGGGPLELWEKWTFPLGETSLGKYAEGWVTLRKSRRRRAFELTGTGLAERPTGEAIEPGCTLELTEVDVGGDAWWTLAFEASGPPEMLEPNLRACAGLFLDGQLPNAIGLSPRTSMSYTRWLSRRHSGDDAPPG